jgi:hypothetical protein
MTGKRVSLRLTPEQQQAVRALTGRDAEAIELGVEELEERIAPSRIQSPGGPVPIPYPNVG